MENKSKFIILFGIVFLVMNLFFVSGFGYDNPTLPNVPSPEVTVITFQNSTGGVNTSDYWDGLGTINATQMEDSGGVLSIIQSWIESLISSVSSSAFNRSGTDVFLHHTGDSVGIGTNSPYSGLHYQGDIFYLTPNAGADSNDSITIYTCKVL